MTPAGGAPERDLRVAIELWPLLAESRIPGTPRPWRPSELSPEATAERDRQARLERLERTDSPGEHPAPLHLDVLDTLASVLIDADDAAERVADAAGHPRLEQPSSAYVDARPYLTFAADHVSEVTYGVVFDGIADLARQMRGEISRSLALMWDGQRLTVVCPWCGGGVRGEPTWRVRELPGGLISIICEGEVCEPPQRDVGTWWRGRPAWPLWEWEWLAKRVEASERRSA